MDWCKLGILSILRFKSMVQRRFESLSTGSFSGSNNAGGGNWYTGSGGYEGIGHLDSTQSLI